MKVCYKCNENKPLDAYPKDKNKCKKCLSEYLRQFRKRQKDPNYKKHKPQEIINNTLVCRFCNQRKDLSHFRKRHERLYRYECNECKREYMNEYYQDVYNEVRRNRKKDDIQFRLLSNHRNYVYKCLTKYQNKRGSSESYIGCSLTHFKEWLEYQFDENCNWENYGTYWTIDHVLPLSKFDLTRDDHQAIAFHWTNLSPSTDNFQKSDNIHIWTYFNTFISVHRFIQNKDNHETTYQTLSNSLAWLKTCNTFKLRETPKVLTTTC